MSNKPSITNKRHKQASQASSVKRQASPTMHPAPSLIILLPHQAVTRRPTSGVTVVARAVVLAVAHDLLAPDRLDIVVARIEVLLFALALVRSVDDADVLEVGKPETFWSFVDDRFNLQCTGARSAGCYRSKADISTHHDIPSVAVSLDRFGAVLPGERCTERIHLVEIRRRLFPSREKNVSSRPAPFRKITADRQRPGVGVVLFLQLVERARSARRDGKAVRYLLEKGFVVHVVRVVILFLRELFRRDAEMRRDDTANGCDPLILDVLFRRCQQSRAENLGIVKRLVLAWSRFGPQESHDGALVRNDGPRRDKHELGLERPHHGSIGLLESRLALSVLFVLAFPCFFLFDRRPVFDSERSPRCDEQS